MIDFEAQIVKAMWSIMRIHGPPAAAKSLQSCPTLCDPIDGSPPGSPVPGILQARTLEWVAISFSSAWKWKLKVKSLSRVQPSATPWTAAFQAPLSMGFSRQEYCSGVPLPSPKWSWSLYNINKCYLGWLRSQGCQGLWRKVVEIIVIKNWLRVYWCEGLLCLHFSLAFNYVGLEVNLSQVLGAVNVICGQCFPCFSSYVREGKDADIRRVSASFPGGPVAGTTPSSARLGVRSLVGSLDSTCLKAKHTDTHTHTHTHTHTQQKQHCKHAKKT